MMYATHKKAFLISWPILGIIIMTFFFVACKKTSPGENSGGDKLVVLAELMAGDSVEIPIGRTVKVGGSTPVGFQKVNDATVTLNNENGLKWMLQPNWGPQFASNPTTVFTNRHRLKANTIYNIEVKHPVLGTITATTHIPSVPTILSFDTATEMHQGRETMATTITWNDDQNGGDYFVLEAVKELVRIQSHFYYQGRRYNMASQTGRTMYEQVKNLPGIVLFRDTLSLNKFLRINLYTQDILSENALIDKLDQPFRRIFYHSSSPNPSVLTAKFYVDRQFFVAGDPTQKGRLLVQLKRTSKEFFGYLLLYEKYKTDLGAIPADQLTTPVGNVQNGVGIFGGAAKKQRVFYFDRL